MRTRKLLLATCWLAPLSSRLLNVTIAINLLLCCASGNAQTNGGLDGLPRKPMRINEAIPQDRYVSPAQFSTPPSEVWSGPTQAPVQQQLPRLYAAPGAPATTIAPRTTAPGTGFGVVPRGGQIIPGSQVVVPPGTASPLDPFNPSRPGPNRADVIIDVNETQTQQLLFGLGLGSDAGVTGQIIFEDRNFGLTAFPSRVGWRNAFRGGGQRLRIEAVPGNELQRYLISFTEPKLFDRDLSFSTSGFYFDRGYRDWDQLEYGGRIALGRRFDRFSLGVALRGKQVDISNPRVQGVTELERVLGTNDIFGGKATLTYDNRDHPYWSSAGSFLEMSFEQVFGDFDYPRGTLDYRRYFQIYERADGTGRQVLTQRINFGITGSQTPIFDNFFAGGHSSLRGFRFRGASPKDMDVIVGGELMLLGSTEYIFPITADDMVRGVVFSDYGTIEEDLDIDFSDFRVSVGAGLRISVPFLGTGAPIAIDFAVPLNRENTDRVRNVSFFFGVGR